MSQVVRDLWTTRPHVAAALSGVPAPHCVAAAQPQRHAAGEQSRQPAVEP